MGNEQTDREMRTRPSSHCCLCGAEGSVLYAGFHDRLFSAQGKWNFRKCLDPHCGTMWLDPIPLEQDLYKAYLNYFTHGDLEQAPDVERAAPRGSYRWLRKYLKTAYFASIQGYTLRTNRLQQLIGCAIRLHPLWSRHLKRVSNYVHYKHDGKLLDVGCGEGIYLDLMQKLGWNVTGVEVDPSAVERARLRGLLVHHGTLEDQAFTEDEFDVITLNHVLEHVHHPLRLLQECFRVLKPGGIIRIFVPNPVSLGHRVFRSEWVALDPPRHLHLWSPEGLTRIAIRAGFKVTIESSSAPARFDYLYSHDSFRTAARAVGTSLPMRVQGFFFESMKSYFFDLYEALGIALGRRMWGEELVLKGKKGSSSIPTEFSGCTSSAVGGRTTNSLW